MSNMEKVRPRLPSGFIEFLPSEQIIFNRMLETVRQVYELHGFSPIETPAVELEQILLAKGGGENDDRIFWLARADEGNPEIKVPTGTGLHFDLTVPVARYVAQYADKLAFPFRRYQIQKVWRGERAQRGRYREFYQCDVDVLGTTDPNVDAEMLSVVKMAFNRLGFDAFKIHLNNIKVVKGVIEALGMDGYLDAIMGMVDKLDKLGRDGFAAALCELGADSVAVQRFMTVISQHGDAKTMVNYLASLDLSGELLDQGIAELFEVTRAVELFGVPPENWEVDLGIVRGMAYYTGTVYETFLSDYSGIGSVCSGGRFDNLAEYYIDRRLPGVGLSIGLTRLFTALRELSIVAIGAASPSQVLIASRNREALPACIGVASLLRSQGVKTEVLFQEGLGRQLKYANRLGVPYVAIVSPCDGEVVSLSTCVEIKHMESGAQTKVTVDDAIAMLTA